MFREPTDPPSFGAWVNRRGTILGGDEGQARYFGDTTNCLLPVADEHVAYAGWMFQMLVSGKRNRVDSFLNGITVNGDVVVFRVIAELVARADDDVWVAIHGWAIDEQIAEQRMRKRG